MRACLFVKFESIVIEPMLDSDVLLFAYALLFVPS